MGNPAGRQGMNKDLHVVVLMGGWGSEREVSLTSGRGVAAALSERGWSKVTEIDMELTKMVLVPHGVRMPGGRVVTSQSLFQEDPIPRPFVVKPVNEGSSVGVAIVTDDGNYGNPIGRDVDGPWQHFR